MEQSLRLQRGKLWHADFVICCCIRIGVLSKGFNEIEGLQNVQPADYCSIFISFNVAIVQCLFIIIAMLSAFLQ
jgi:hypothetical protein